METVNATKANPIVAAFFAFGKAWGALCLALSIAAVLQLFQEATISAVSRS
jgi:hypothetical protein